MEQTLDSTRGFERRDPHWHGSVEVARTVDEVVVLVREYLAGLAPERYLELPESCRGVRVKAEDDIEYWTLRLSQRHASRAPGVDRELTQDLFDHFLHATLRIAHLNRAGG
ncbi:MAG TPA: hypothetical protein VFE23_19180 [Usitatibacter sp.]|nr:hypothetical protein [Usitatibacter sp.]